MFWAVAESVYNRLLPLAKSIGKLESNSSVLSDVPEFFHLLQNVSNGLLQSSYLTDVSAFYALIIIPDKFIIHQMLVTKYTLSCNEIHFVSNYYEQQNSAVISFLHGQYFFWRQFTMRQLRSINIFDCGTLARVAKK
jgi:hypothetical protein